MELLRNMCMEFPLERSPRRLSSAHDEASITTQLGEEGRWSFPMGTEETIEKDAQLEGNILLASIVGEIKCVQYEMANSLISRWDFEITTKRYC